MTIGKSLPHDSAPLHVTGQARYADDVPLPANALHLAFGLSTCAHGTITAIDLSAVRAAPGVTAVYSAEDWPNMPDCSPSVHDEPLLAVGRVHYVGQPVFLVAADSHLNARKAARLAKITYAELPALLTVDDALAAVAIPRFVDLRGDAVTAATQGVGGGLSSASSVNFAARSARGATTATVPITTCDSVRGALQGGLPAGYTTDAAVPVAAGATVNCTLTNTNVTPNVTASFSAIGIL